MRTRHAACVAACIAGAVVGGCGGSDGSSSPDRKSTGEPTGSVASGALVEDGTLDYAIAADPGTLDPAKTITGDAQELFAFTYDTLVATDSDGEITSNLATEWEIQPTRARFTLRDGVTCADGSPVTASVVKRNLDHLKDPKVQSPRLASFVTPPPDYTVTADDATRTVTIRFGRPQAFVLNTIQGVPIVCGKGLEDRSALARGTSGSGPYVLTEAVANDHYTLTRRDGYAWGPGGATTDEPGQPETVVMRVVPNRTTVANLLLEGTVQAAQLNGPETQRLSKQGLGEQRRESSLDLMLFNQSEGRVAGDPAVRRALTMAVNRAEVAKVVATGGTGRPADSLIPSTTNPCAQGDASPPIPGHDVAAAQAALDAAGWAKGSDGVRAKDGARLELTVLNNASVGPTYAAGTELVAKAWRELGADVRIKAHTTPALTQALSTGEWDAVPLFGLTVPVPSQFVAFVSGPAPPQGANFGAIDNAAYTKLVGQAIATADQAKACDLWNEAEAALFSEADIVPMVAKQSSWWSTKTVEYLTTAYDMIPTSIRVHEG